MKELVAKFNTKRGPKEGLLKKMNLKTVLVEVDVPPKEGEDPPTIPKKTIIKRHIKKHHVVVKGEV